MAHTLIDSDSVRHLDFKRDPMLFHGEAPEQIIAFIKILRLSGGNLELAFDAKRLRLENYEWLDEAEFRKAATGLVKSLAQKHALDAKDAKKVRSELASLINSSGNDLAAELAKIDTGFENTGFREMEYNKPTLILQFANLPSLKFSDPCMQVHPECAELDCNCVNPRLWDNDKLFGWYSRYREGDPKAVTGKWRHYMMMELDEFGTNSFVMSMMNGGGGAAPFDPGQGSGGNWPP